MKHFYNQKGLELERGPCLEKVASINRHLMIFSLVVLNGMPRKEVAEQLGLPLGIVTSSLKAMIKEFSEYRRDKLSRDRKMPGTDVMKALDDQVKFKIKFENDDFDEFLNWIKTDEVLKELKESFEALFRRKLARVAYRIEY